MSWQHLNQPQGWIGEISLSLSLFFCNLTIPSVTHSHTVPLGCVHATTPPIGNTPPHRLSGCVHARPPVYLCCAWLAPAGPPGFLPSLPPSEASPRRTSLLRPDVFSFYSLLFVCEWGGPTSPGAPHRACTRRPGWPRLGAEAGPASGPRRRARRPQGAARPPRRPGAAGGHDAGPGAQRPVRGPVEACARAPGQLAPEGVLPVRAAGSKAPAGSHGRQGAHGSRPSGKRPLPSAYWGRWGRC